MHKSTEELQDLVHSIAETEMKSIMRRLAWADQRDVNIQLRINGAFITMGTMQLDELYGEIKTQLETEPDAQGSRYVTMHEVEVDDVN